MSYELLKEFCASNNIDIRFNEPMSRHTSLRIGGQADIAIFPTESFISETIEILTLCKLPYIVVGGGTNILVKDSGIGGAVIFTTKMNSIEHRTQNTDEVNILVQSGCSLQGVVNLCSERGFSGIEGLAGIPGTIGGAIAGNAGSFGCEIKDATESIRLLTDNSIKTVLKPDIGFEYRRTKIPQDSVIVSALMSLKKDNPFDVKKRVAEFINEKRLKQPFSSHSAGCVFKNPKNLSAGRLIEEAGCKGLRVGDVEVSSMHANFFINKGKASANDYLRLMDIVSTKVDEKFKIVLEPEIKIISGNQ